MSATLYSFCACFLVAATAAAAAAVVVVAVVVLVSLLVVAVIPVGCRVYHRASFSQSIP